MNNSFQLTHSFSYNIVSIVEAVSNGRFIMNRVLNKCSMDKQRNKYNQVFCEEIFRYNYRKSQCFVIVKMLIKVPK